LFHICSVWNAIYSGLLSPSCCEQGGKSQSTHSCVPAIVEKASIVLAPFAHVSVYYYYYYYKLPLKNVSSTFYCVCLLTKKTGRTTNQKLM